MPLPPSHYRTGVYKIVNRVNGKVYVGGAYKDLVQRRRMHWSDLKLGKHWNNHLQRSWDKYGGSAFVFCIIERCPPGYVKVREQFWIDSCSSSDPKCGYNKSPTAGSNLGIKASQDTIAKISAAAKKQWQDEDKLKSMKKKATGRRHSAETLKKMSDSHKGVPLTEEHKNKIAEGIRLALASPEVRKKMSEAQLGKIRGPEFSAKMSAIVTARYAAKREKDSHAIE